MISVLIPFHNEEENVPVLRDRLMGVLDGVGEAYELLFVDDGSTDDTANRVAADGVRVQLLKHRRQMGKGRALATAFAAAKGDVIVFMDADLEDDPDELPRFLEKIRTGYDLVNGVRKGRKHSGIIRFYSSLANQFIRRFLRSPFTDINCGYKAMKRPVLETITLYGNNFRFLPLGAFYEGFKVTEIEVKHKNRVHGVSKFGTGKVFIGLIDTVTAYFLYRFSERPLHFFGSIGAVVAGFGSAILLWLGVERILLGHEIYRRPVLFLGMLLVIVGVQVGATGLLGELIVYMHKRNRS
jgi:glycosyltransferase involved in cell wall biosynthesis